ncbi:nucleotidyltransferase family protein [Alteromonas sp. ASW11-19]|uniref:Nucleotidyltransferase family protein n=1 Tax=Alteromonas salexigens TaxID=2982530 RepID=A0ABT2VNX4_9ALTE|nr:nucleotidyltransferase family protein [Alteromonas salexigens]MCU7555010.1 nucleotidyltransferase family protein [Alteromonas salexigens]
MKAVLLAAGEGTRLRPLTLHTPKCLVPINGKPLLDYWLEMLSSFSSITEIFVNTHYLHEQVESHLDRVWRHLDNLKCWYEPQLLGTAGTLLNNMDALSEGDVLVVHADNLSVFDLAAFIEAHQNRPAHCVMTMMLFKSDTPTSCGIVELDGTTIIDMHEKVANPPGNLANGAVYILSLEAITLLRNSNISDISTQLIPMLLGRINGWVNHRYHRDIGTPASYKQALSDFQNDR